MDSSEVVIRLITEFREDMNKRFERVEQRFDQRFERVDQRFEQLERRLDGTDGRFASLELKLMREIAKIDERLTEEALWGRRELRARVEKCEREIEDLKKRSGS
jgi:hypothetical protein